MEYCPDAQLDPKEPPYQWLINHLARLRDERFFVSRYAEDQEFCKDAWIALIQAYEEEIEYDEFCLKEERGY